VFGAFVTMRLTCNYDVDEEFAEKFAMILQVEERLGRALCLYGGKPSLDWRWT